MRKVLFLLVFLLSIALGYAQQDPLFNKYMFNPLVLNPAYAGSREAMSAVLLHRSQWVGFEDAPSTQTFSIHSPFLRNKVGLGLSAMHDEVGPTSSTSIAGSYAYRLKLGTGTLALGLRSAVYFYKFSWDKISVKDNTDTHIGNGNSSYSIPSFDFGIWYNTKLFYAGFSAAHLYQLTLGNQEINTLQYDASLVTHLTGVFGYVMELNQNMLFKPSILVKSSKAQTPSIDFNMSILTNKILWLGITIRSNYGVVAMAEYNLNKNFRMGCSYDFSLGKIRNYNAGSIEFFVGFDFNPLKSTTLSPRYF